MAEYYELTLTHRVQNGGGYDPHIEPPLTVKYFISPYMPYQKVEREVLIDDMCRELKEYWMQKGR